MRSPPPGASSTLANSVRARAIALARRLLAQRDQIGAEVGLARAHPRRQPRVDPPRHLGRARLGEGQAQDRARIGAAEQQAIDPRRQHLRLARPRRRRQPDVRAGIARARLLVDQRREVAGCALLTAVPFVAPHQLVVVAIGRVFGAQLGGERLGRRSAISPRRPRNCASRARRIRRRGSGRACLGSHGLST